MNLEQQGWYSRNDFSTLESAKSESKKARKKRKKKEGKSIDEKGIYYFTEVVHQYSCQSAIEWIMRKNMKTDDEDIPKKLTIVINSPGGSVYDCFALLDAMKASKIPVHTVGTGIIASCGLLMFLGGEKRTLSPNTSVLSHQFSTMSMGKEHDLRAEMVEYDIISDRIIGHYEQATGLDRDVIKKELLPPSDTWLTTEQCLEYGIAHKVKIPKLF